MALVVAQLVESELVVVADEVRPLAVLGDRRKRHEGELQRRCIFARESEEHRLIDGEGEDQLQLIAVLVAEELALLIRRQVDLPEQHHLAVAAAKEAP